MYDSRSRSDPPDEVGQLAASGSVTRAVSLLLDALALVEDQHVVDLGDVNDYRSIELDRVLTHGSQGAGLFAAALADHDDLGADVLLEVRHAVLSVALRALRALSLRWLTTSQSRGRGPGGWSHLEQQLTLRLSRGPEVGLRRVVLD
jgi:hypothetical protein